MAFADDVIDALASLVNTALAPYQPNVPSVPNTDPRAGTIASTLISGGHPIQVKVTTRLENKMAQVAVYDMPPEKLFPYVNDAPVGIDSSGNVTYEVGATEKRFCVEVWAFSRDSRRAIRDNIRASLTDVFRIQQSDGTVTLLTYLDDVTFDYEQKDSIYIAQMHYQGNFTILGSSPGGTVTSIDLGIKISDTLDVISPAVSLGATNIVVTPPNTNVPDRLVYTYDQTTPALTWTIVHNLGYNPQVSVYDEDGNSLYPLVTNPDLNTTVLGFLAAVEGVAYLSK